MNHTGTKNIETSRLLLRRARISDVEPMFRNWANDRDVTKYLTWPPHSNPDVTEMILSHWIQSYEKNEFYQWLIALKENESDPIGSISVVAMDSQTKCMEIGYCIGKNWWHQGIMTEALKGVMEYLFKNVNVNRLEARHDINNIHSGAVMRKCGMEYEGTLRKAGWNNQGICDLCIYAKLSEKK